MQKLEKLQASYKRLTKARKLILRVLSVVYEPANQTTLNTIIADIYRARTDYRMLDLNVSKAVKSELEEKGLIQIKQGRLKCHPHIEEWLTLQSIENNEFDIFMAAAVHRIPFSEKRYYHYSMSPYEEKRKLRYALYSYNYDEVYELLGITDPYAELNYESSRLLAAIFTTPLHGGWYQTLHPAIQYQILYPLLKESVTDWSNVSDFYQLLCKIGNGKTEQDYRIKELIAQQRLLRGDWQSLEDYLNQIDSVNADTLRACLYFLQDKTTEALALFQVVIARIKKASRKRNISIEGLPGVLYLLALLKQPGESSRKLARQQSVAANKLNYFDTHYNEMRLLQQVREINEGTQSSRNDYQEMRYAFELPLTHLIAGLALYWNNQKPTVAFLKSLDNNSSKAKSAGYFWFSRECDQLLARFKNSELPVDDRWCAPLVSVIPKLTDWERSLNALTTVAAPTREGAKKSPAAVQAMRVAWLVGEDDYGGLSIKPREQKQKKNGSWTAGRAIALKRLAEESEGITYLTEADKKICRCIRQERNRDHYGYSNPSYKLDSIQALLAAEGHPCLYSVSNPSQQIDISIGAPELLVVTQGDYILLTLEPYPMEEKYLILEETAASMRIYQYSSELLHIAKILSRNGLQVPKTAKEKLLDSVSAIAPLLTIHSDVDGITDHQAELVVADDRLCVHLQPHKSGLRLSFHVQPFSHGPVLVPGKGGESLFAEINGKQLQTKRDLAAETERFSTVMDACKNLYQFAANDWRWEETEDALEGLLILQSMGEDKVILEWPVGKEIRLSRTVGVSDMSVSLRQKTDWFEIDGELKIDEGQVHSMQVLLQLINESDGRFVKMADGQFLSLTTELRRRLDELSSYSNKGQIHSLNAINLEESIDGMAVDADQAWDRFRQRLQQARDLKPTLPSTLQADLRDYQLLGFNWLSRLSTWGAGACLADDMGLGKTLQALALIVDRAAEGPTLILAPTTVCANWIEETARFAPTLNPVRFGSSDRKKMLASLKPYDLLICSYGLLQSEAEALQAIHWHTIVADEAQAFKNPTTKRSKAVMGLSADFKMIATGTPIENHLGELWNLFQFINPGLLGARDAFNDKFAYPIENRQDRAASIALKKLISPFILRRLKREVLKELPPRTEITLRVDLSPQETALYEALRQEAVTQLSNVDMKPNQQRMQALASITKLRRAVCNPNIVLKGANLPSAKLQVFDDIVHELVENNHKALVFSQFVDHLSLIRAHLDKLGFSYQYLDGSTPTRKRTAAINAFQAGEGDLFLISLKAGGVGLNLTAADYVIHMDPWWNPAVEDQASDRAHRIGQLRPVTVYRIVANDTIEEKIVSLHAQKRDLADSLLEGTEMSAKMSLDDMLALLDDDST